MARILLVDDDLDIRELGRALLTHAGHDAFVSDGAINALHFLRRNEIDILVTDALMPNLSGFDLIKLVRLDQQFERMKVVMLTASREKEDIEKAIGVGADSYVIKPIEPTTFLEKIAEVAASLPPKERALNDFLLVRMSASAKAEVKVDIRSVSELGLVFRAPHSFRAGSRISLSSEIFDEIGITAPQMRVFTCRERDGIWETRVSFIDVDEATMQTIRSWVLRKTKSKRKAAA